ncbi:MAG: RNA polymerase sigma factor (sigma-70 family) [Planctomycetota bacterium]|jgi:RNA polymerase sigma factor (sigma-70 family)
MRALRRLGSRRCIETTGPSAPALLVRGTRPTLSPGALAWLLAEKVASMSELNTNTGQDHHNEVTWYTIIESVGPSGCVVVIDSWMGKTLSGMLTAEDIWQETLVLSWRDREQHEWQNVRAYRGWLLEIARNRIRDHARRMQALKRGGGQGTSLFSEMNVEEGATLAGLLPGCSTTPSRISSTNERAAQMREALTKLTEDQAQIVRLPLFEERPMAEIALDLKIGLAVAWYRFRQGSEMYARVLARDTSMAPSEVEPPKES